jgi:hypothetical protein
MYRVGTARTDPVPCQRSKENLPTITKHFEERSELEYKVLDSRFVRNRQVSLNVEGAGAVLPGKELFSPRLADQVDTIVE